MFDFKGPPFVGGPDLIKNGIVIEPITAEFSTIKQVGEKTCNVKPEEKKQAGGEFGVFIASHGVPNHEDWYVQFRAADQFHDDLGITYSHASFFEQDGKPFVQVIHVFPKDKEEGMRKAMDFKGPPFVGGPDLIKNGIIIEPIISQFSDLHAVVAPGETISKDLNASTSSWKKKNKEHLHQDGEVCFIASHGVPDFDGWYAQYLEADKSGFHTDLGINKSMISKYQGADGKQMIQVFHFLPKDRLADAQKVFDFAGPPFVGGPDLIKNGIVIEPIVSRFTTIKKVDYSMIVASHGVPDHDQWYKAFREHDKFHDDLGITESVASLYEQDGKKMIQVIHVFPKGKTEGMAKAMDFTGPPFVGGPDLIKNGIIIEPINKQFSDIHSIAQPGEHEKLLDQRKVVLQQHGEVAFVAGHGVPSYEGWYKNYLEADMKTPIHTDLGITRSIVSKYNDKDGKQMIQVVHFLPKDKEEDAKKVFNFTGPPFVGGPDLIKNGIVIEPITAEFSTVQKVDA